jgi:hypothetical protein
MSWWDTTWAESVPTPVSVAAGDRIDFAVGDGTDGNFYYDSTGIAATIIELKETISARESINRRRLRVSSRKTAADWLPRASCQGY